MPVTCFNGRPTEECSSNKKERATVCDVELIILTDKNKKDYHDLLLSIVLKVGGVATPSARVGCGTS